MVVEYNWIGVLVNFLSGLGLVGALAVILAYTSYVYSLIAPLVKSGDVGAALIAIKWKLFGTVAVGLMLTITISAASTYRPKIATQETFGGSRYNPDDNVSESEFIDHVPEYKTLERNLESEGTSNPDATFEKFNSEMK